MKRMILAGAAIVALAGCQTQKSSNPLSPSVAGPIPGVNISVPTLLEPGQGFRFKESEQPIKLLIENASSNGARPVTYTFEVAVDSNFDTKVFARGGVAPGSGGRTSVQIDRLEVGRAYYWRARADDGANTSLYSTAQFELLPKPLLNSPGLVSPINNERADSLRPTFTVTNSDRNAAVGSVSYDFQVALDQAFTQMITSGIVSETDGLTRFTSPNDIVYDRVHYWRVRGFDGEVTGSWAGTQSFRGPAPAGPTSGPGPQPGGSCASNSGPAVVQCVAATYPDRLAAGVSLNQRVANMEFLRDRVIEAGICGGMDLARNRKRGNGPHSIDALAWRHDGIDDVVDIGAAYDDTSRPLGLTWGIVEGPPGYDGYPRPSCS